jgi:hypothetical protein
MVFIARQEPFDCGHCGIHVDPLEDGSYRNHCPKCLWSKHVDDKGPGDRASACKSMMKPTGLDYRKKKGWMIVHLCEACGKEIPNMTACDDDLSVLKS